MSALSTHGGGHAALAANRLGVRAVVSFIVSAVAPLTVAAGVVTTMYAVTGLSAIGAAFLIVAVVLAVFASGYIAMARRITNAGAFYAFISRGLGRPVGVGAAVVALIAYNLLQVGLDGMFGPTVAGYVAEKSGGAIDLPWWTWALVAWLVVAFFGWPPGRDRRVGALGPAGRRDGRARGALRGRTQRTRRRTLARQPVARRAPRRRGWAHCS